MVNENSLARAMTAHAEHVMSEVYLPRIVGCLNKLSRPQIWWRSSEASNSVGNLVLHLEGNVRQWILAGLGGQPDNRQRDVEFKTRRPLQRRLLIEGLQQSVGAGRGVLKRLSAEDLVRIYSIQKFKVTGLEAVFHVAEHFSHHAGQIILLTKMMSGNDLKFTELPNGKKKKAKLPPW